MVYRPMVITISVMMCLAGRASAQQGGSPQQYRLLEQRVAELEQRLQATPLPATEPTMIGNAGVKIQAGATMVGQGTGNVNNAAADVQKKTSRADASYSADITAGKTFHDDLGTVFLHLEVGQGAGLEDELTLYSNVNRDADNDNNVRLTELWYEYAFSDQKAVVTAGKLDPTAYFDNNEAANDETAQFLGRIFRNSPVVEFPDNSAGVRVAYVPAERIELGYALFDGDGDWEKIGDAAFQIAQLSLSPELSGLPGNYRVYCWHSNVYHTTWLDAERNKEEAYGFGLSFDQQVTDAVMLFCRYGWQNPRVYNPGLAATGDRAFSLEQAWSAGVQVEGGIWGRDEDAAGFAVGQAIASGEYKQADPSLQAESEGHLELYYRIHINEHLSVSPDLQYIWNPFGTDIADDTSSIFIGGLRAQLDF